MTNREKALKLINEYLAKQDPQKVELALDLGGLKSYASSLKSKIAGVAVHLLRLAQHSCQPRLFWTYLDLPSSAVSCLKS